MKKANLKDRIILSIHAYNKCLTRAFLDSQPLPILLANCHPIDRADFIQEITGKRNDFSTIIEKEADNDTL